MSKLLILLSALYLTSCGAYKWWGAGPENSRKIASLSVQQLLVEDENNFAGQLSDKINSLHIYYVIGQKNLMEFDSLIEQSSYSQLYQSPAYLNLLAVRTQVDELEHELEELWEELNVNDLKQKKDLKLIYITTIEAFKSRSKLAELSMQNLEQRIALKSSATTKARGYRRLTEKNIKEEYKALSGGHEFMVYEKNIEHLSHMIDVKNITEGKKFYPSTLKAGNITGNEFPPKVWSLTFDDGPGKLTSPVILQNLKDKGLRATFFQLTKQVNALTPLAKDIRDSKMEIASHSYTHQQLTKVGAQALEHEVSQAVKDLEKIQSVDIKFFRLPYGAGVNIPHIREKIAQNDLIHVFWNVDTLDWMAQEPSQIVERTISLMKKTPNDAGVLLFHDIHQRTVVASVQIMDYLKKDGRRVCTLDEIVTQMNEGVETVCLSK